MLKYLADPANATTACGILFSGIALHSALSGRLELAIAFGLWAMLADQLDGILAKRTKGRSEEFGKMGKSLDGFSDIIYGSVIPAIIIMVVAESSVIAMVPAIGLLLAGALRLSYFNNFGLSGGSFTGVPLSYDVPVLAVLFLARPLIANAAFVPMVLIAFAVLGCLHVSSLRVPAPGRAMYFGIIVFCTVASAALVRRTLT